MLHALQHSFIEAKALQVVEITGRAVEQTHDGDRLADQGMNPLLVIDLWEHAYYLDRQNARPAYLEAAIGVLNWDFAAENLARGSAWEYPA